MKKIYLILLLLLISISVFAQKIEKQADGSIVVTGDNYIAKTSMYNGGYLVSLSVNNIEFIDQNIEGTRGSYLFRNGVVKATKSEFVGNKLTLNTSNDDIIIYEFKPKEIIITSSVKSKANYYFVLNPFKGAKVKDTIYKTPFRTEEKSGIIASQGVGLEFSGDISFWGPWTNNTQIVDMTFSEPGTKSVSIKPIIFTQEEYLLYDTLLKNIISDYTLYHPKNYEVFQRETKDKGYIKIDGKVSNKVIKVEYKITGKDYKGKSVSIGWKNLNFDSIGIYKGQIPCPAGGWYNVKLRYTFKNKETKIYEIKNVGVGEVIVGAGQSNSTNFGETKTETKTKMVSTTDGESWRLCNDPMPGVHDRTGGGSLYPSLGDALYKEFNVPIGITSTGFGGTSTFQWQPDANAIDNSNLFDWFIKRVLSFGPYGFRCVLWHQGESDNGIASSDLYYTNLATIVNKSRELSGWYIPWFTAKVSCWHENGKDNKVRDGQQKMWDTGVSFEGPDTDTLWGEDIREAKGKGVHFAEKGLKKHGEWWAEIISKFIHKQID